MNLQAICGWNSEFLRSSISFTASTHDSTAFKATKLYLDRCRYFNPNSYVLADKAYQLEGHFITPFKNPTARLPSNSAFNQPLSNLRVKIEHALGVLKARFPSLIELSVCIREDVYRDHMRVHKWTIACMVLHNILYFFEEADTWFLEPIQEENNVNNKDKEEENITGIQESEKEAKQAGVRRREELRDMLLLRGAR